MGSEREVLAEGNHRKEAIIGLHEDSDHLTPSDIESLILRPIDVELDYHNLSVCRCLARLNEANAVIEAMRRDEGPQTGGLQKTHTLKCNRTRKRQQHRVPGPTHDRG